MVDLWVVVGVLFAIISIPYLFVLIGLALIRPEGSPADKSPIEPSVSILLPTYNEERIIERKLQELVDLAYPAEKLQVVIVDSSDDATPDIVEAFFEGRSSPTLTLIREDERRGVASAINTALEHIEHEIVVRTDCDSSIARDGIAEAVSNFADDDIGAVTGRHAEVIGGSAVESGYRGMLDRVQALESHLDSTFIFHGPFSAYRTTYLEPLDPRSLADDTEFAVNIRRQGKRVIFDPSMQFEEASRSGILARRRQKDRRAMGLLRLLGANRDAIGHLGRYGKVVLPLNWWFMVISPWLLALAVFTTVVVSLLEFGALGMAVPIALGVFVLVGQRDLLGPLQFLYSFIDTQVSLIVAGVKLVVYDADGMWEPEAELREAFD